ncbi:MAG: SGNH/GDSL hydrolase family protein, partial [Candidatus Thiodiazotropha endolucinida]|nr:SGNH/GDSL hydrolase family protein [Candidatus Thiodiazotropha taylori]MCW4262291.1 SGNH/GDSL hydrolase family protein [Candidatus Thiodiazotropha endolucinida]
QTRSQNRAATRKKTEPKKSPVNQQDGKSNRSTLIIGDSILHGINMKGLISTAHKHSVSGAKIDNILTDIRRYDLKNFSSIIVYVGGNDFAGGIDPELFEEKYDQLLSYIKKETSNCNVVLCSICPRKDIDENQNCELNDIIQNLTKDHNCVLADMFNAFHEKDGGVCERFFQFDSVHINPSGIKRFLRVLHDIEFLVKDFDQCSHPKKSTYRPKRRRYDRNFLSQRGNVRRNATNRTTKCDKCGESNHATNSCHHKNQLRCFDCLLYGHKSSRCENRH